MVVQQITRIIRTLPIFVTIRKTFFATNHGKQTCYGISGTVKRIVSKESLQRPTTKQSLSTESMFEYCRPVIEGTMCIW